jgi:ABC-2 type transport system permease protein
LADPRLTIAGRELRVLGREKTIVLALLIQLFIAAFSSFLVVGLVSLYDPGSVEGYEVEVAVTGDARADLLAAVQETPSLGGQGYDSRDAALSAFENEQVDAVLATDTADGRVQVRAIAPDSNVRTTLVVVQLRDALRTFERGERAERAASLEYSPLDLPPEGTSSPYYSFTYTVLVPLLLFLPVFISGSIAVDSLTEEFERGTLELLRVAPISLLDIVDGKLLAAAVLAPAQAALWIGLLRFNGTAVSNPVVLVALVAAFSLLVVGLGSAVGLLAPDRRAAQFVYSIGVLAAFGGATLLPGSPANTVAKLAIGSADAVTYLTVGGYGVLAVGAYLLVRVLVTRVEVVSA